MGGDKIEQRFFGITVTRDLGRDSEPTGQDCSSPLTVSKSALILCPGFASIRAMRNIKCFGWLVLILSAGFLKAQTNTHSVGRDKTNAITRETVEQAEKLIGLSFSDSKNRSEEHTSEL